MLNVEIIIRHDHLRVVWSGCYDDNHEEDTYNKSILITDTALNTPGCLGILIDARDFDTCGKLPQQNHVKVANKFEDVKGSRIFKSAILVQPSIYEELRFCENAFRNRGVPIRYFKNENCALDWIRTGKV